MSHPEDGEGATYHEVELCPALHGEGAAYREVELCPAQVISVILFSKLWSPTREICFIEHLGSISRKDVKVLELV